MLSITQIKIWFVVAITTAAAANVSSMQLQMHLEWVVMSVVSSRLLLLLFVSGVLPFYHEHDFQIKSVNKACQNVSFFFEMWYQNLRKSNRFSFSGFPYADTFICRFLFPLFLYYYLLNRKKVMNFSLLWHAKINFWKLNENSNLKRDS